MESAIRTRYDRQHLSSKIERHDQRWNIQGSVSPEPPRLDGEAVKGETHYERRAFSVRHHHHTHHVEAIAEIWTLFGRQTIGECPYVPHLSSVVAKHDLPSTDPVSADDVWTKLKQAVAERYTCPTEVCCQVSAGTDFVW